jgi:hypothetical protein
MTTLHRRLAVATLVALVALPAAANRKPNEFDAARFDTPEERAEQAGKYWRPQGLRKIRGSGFQKVVIPEFTVEYVVKSKYDYSGGGLGLWDIAQAAGAGKKRMEIDEETKRTLPRKLYDAFVEQLTQAGYEVKPIDEVVASSAFAKFAGHDDPDKTKQVHGGGYRPTTTEKGEVWSVEGLMDVREGMFAVAGNMKAEAELLHEIGSDVSMRVHLRVGNVKGKPTYEDGSLVVVSAGPQAAGASWTLATQGTLASKDGLLMPEDASESKEFKGGKGKVITMDSAKYTEALLAMTHPFLGMALAILEQQP